MESKTLFIEVYSFVYSHRRPRYDVKCFMLCAIQYCSIGRLLKLVKPSIQLYKFKKDTTGCNIWIKKTVFCVDNCNAYSVLICFSSLSTSHKMGIPTAIWTCIVYLLSCCCTELIVLSMTGPIVVLYDVSFDEHYCIYSGDLTFVKFFLLDSSNTSVL